MRTKYSIYNVASGMFAQVLLVIFGLVSRKIFVMTLGVEVQGINATLTSIITMLSLAELGIGVAIICNLYKPLAEDDRPKVISLMQFYSKVYTAIACIVLVLGLAICPFLKLIVKEGDSVSTSYLVTVFLLFVADAVISYLFAYRRSILLADQKNFYINLVDMGINVLINTAQIIVLLLTKNFILYLVIKIIFKFIGNVIIVAITNKKYPYLKKAEKLQVEPEIKKNIISNTKALAMHYIGNYIINGTDMMIITRFLGFAVSGIYSNYLLITSTVRQIFAQFSSGITAGFGNLIALGETEKLYSTFKKALFICFGMTNFATVSLFCVFNPMISVWIGKDYTLPMSVVFIICLNFFVESMSEPLGSLRASAGLFRPDRYLHLFLAVLNLVISVVLVQKIGIFGVFLGTFVCHFIKELNVLPVIVYKNLFKKKAWRYQVIVLLYAVVTVGSTALTYFACSFINVSNIYVNLLLHCVVCTIIPNLIVVICFFKTEEFKYTITLIKNTLFKILRKSPSAGE